MAGRLAAHWAAIREHVASGDEAVNSELQEKLPSAEGWTRVELSSTTKSFRRSPRTVRSIQVVDVKDNVVLLQMGGSCGAARPRPTRSSASKPRFAGPSGESARSSGTTDHSAGRTRITTPARRSNPYHLTHRNRQFPRRFGELERSPRYTAPLLSGHFPAGQPIFRRKSVIRVVTFATGCRPRKQKVERGKAKYLGGNN